VPAHPLALIAVGSVMPRPRSPLRIAAGNLGARRLTRLWADSRTVAPREGLNMRPREARLFGSRGWSEQARRRSDFTRRSHCPTPSLNRSVIWRPRPERMTIGSGQLL
jgi:hypothetical protein